MKKPFTTYCVRMAAVKLLCAALWCAQPVEASADSAPWRVQHLSREQNLVSVPSGSARYLWLPIEDAAPDVKVNQVCRNAVVRSMNIRLARERVDYFIPLELTGIVEADFVLDVQGVPADALCWREMKTSQSLQALRTESYRPAYHHAPLYGWMNDPNGLFYKDGLYHLYYQHNLYGSTWGNMHWGHATSTDLLHWEHRPTALWPDAWGAIFSGSCVVDYGNTAGFGPGAVVAFYTSAKPTPHGDCQTQSIAYSLDGGLTFTKYEKNPVLTSIAPDFRDPKVIWHEATRRWVMLLAVGQEIEIYSSANLKEWTHESQFGLGAGAHGGVWECPDLVELPVKGTKEKKWVLIVNLNPGGPFGGSATQYFVGHFDGKAFTCDSPAETTRWMDYGKDHYAAVSWSNAPDHRCTVIAWMNNWQYAAVVPTKQFRSTNSLPRDLALYRGADKELYLSVSPAKEVDALRGTPVAYTPFSAGTAPQAKALPAEAAGACEIELSLSARSAGKVHLVLSNTKGEQVVMTYDKSAGAFSMDRTQSGLTDFSEHFAAVTSAPCTAGKVQRLRLFIDRCSIEAFDAEGRFAMTNLVFPSEPYTTLSVYTDGGTCKVNTLSVYPLAGQ